MTRPTRRRNAPAILALLLAPALAATGCGGPGESASPEGSATPAIRGFGAAAAERQLAVEEHLATLLDRQAVDANYRELTRLPHPAGSERTREVAEYIRDRFQEYGLEQVQLHRYDVLLPLPREVTVEMLEPVAYRPSLREEPYDVDPDTAQDPGPTYLGMSASGDVTGELVYAHSGNPEDYDWLESQGIDPAGKIAIVRYSVPYSYRGFKAWEAQRRGVKALIVYSDPLEDGFHKGAVFPEGPWGPKSHIQRGSITYDFIVPGDPLTPGWPSLEGSRRIPVQEARSVPDVIAVPMSWGDAQPLLENIGGPEAPESWQGGIEGLTYRAGGAGAVVHVKVDMDGETRPIWVVEGRILGSERPDELVVMGNHHDAWVFGGVDPTSGTATLLETARVLGALAQEGQRPRRTLVFGSWDAEEWHLTGSTEWGEDRGDELSQNAVAYLNVDSSVSGPDPVFEASAVASLNPLIVQTVRDVDDPGREGDTVLETWRTADAGESAIATAVDTETGGEDTDLVANRLGSGSDYTVFLNYLGIPVVDMSFGGEYGVYHSIYDDYWRMQNIADPGLRYMTTMSEILGRMALRLANAQALPYDMGGYAERVGGFLDDLGQIDGVDGNLDLSRAHELVQEWGRLAADADDRVGELLAADDTAALEAINDVLIRAERQLLLRTRAGDDLVVGDGIPDRPWFRHGLYAPRYTYAAMSLPGVTEAAEEGDWERARHELERLEWSFAAMNDLLRQALAASGR